MLLYSHHELSPKISAGAILLYFVTERIQKDNTRIAGSAQFGCPYGNANWPPDRLPEYGWHYAKETSWIIGWIMMNGTIWAAFNPIRTVLEGLADGSSHPVRRSFGPVFIYRSMHGKPCLVLPRNLMILRSQNHESHQRIHET